MDVKSQNYEGETPQADVEEIGPETVLWPHPSVIERALDSGEVVLFHRDTHIHYQLNSTGVQIWDQLKAGGRLTDISGAIQTQYGIDKDTANRTVLKFLQQLFHMSIIHAGYTDPARKKRIGLLGNICQRTGLRFVRRDPRLKSRDLVRTFHQVCHYLSPLPDALPHLPPRTISWDLILSVADNHLVGPTLWSSLCNKGMPGAVPELARAKLKESYEHNRIRNRRIRAQIVEATERLNRSGIEPILLKGAIHLFTDVFPDPGARVMADVDLLVPRVSVDEAIAVLSAMGYQSCEKPEPSAHHYPQLFRPGDEAQIELHHELLSKRTGVYADADWVNTERITTGGVNLRVLTPSFQVLHNILHSEVQDHCYGRGVFDLRHLTELAWLINHYRENINWAEIRRIMERHRKGKILNASLYMVHRLFAIDCPSRRYTLLRGFFHYQRCKATMRWIWFGNMELLAEAFVGAFSADNIRWKYGHTRAPLSLTVGRLRQACRLIKEYGYRREDSESEIFRDGSSRR